MRANLVAVIAEVDEAAFLQRVVRLVRGEHSYDGVCPHAVEGVCVAGDDPFEGVVFQD